MTKYQKIIFIQDSDPELDRLMEDRDFEAICEYLSQWDNGDSGHISDIQSAGTSDFTRTIGEYVVTCNWALGYAGLERIIEE